MLCKEAEYEEPGYNFYSLLDKELNIEVMLTYACVERQKLPTCKPDIFCIKFIMGYFHKMSEKSCYSYLPVTNPTYVKSRMWIKLPN
jgi:hypothetical protein